MRQGWSGRKTMSRNWWILSLAIVLGIFAAMSTALKCYKCTSLSDPGCKKFQWDEKDDMAKVEHPSKTVDCKDEGVCYVMEIRMWKNANQTMKVRDCTNQTCDTLPRNANVYKQVDCCYSDLCNTGSHHFHPATCLLPVLIFWTLLLGYGTAR